MSARRMSVRRAEGASRTRRRSASAAGPSAARWERMSASSSSGSAMRQRTSAASRTACRSGRRSRSSASERRPRAPGSREGSRQGPRRLPKRPCRPLPVLLEHRREHLPRAQPGGNGHLAHQRRAHRESRRMSATGVGGAAERRLCGRRYDGDRRRTSLWLGSVPPVGGGDGTLRRVGFRSAGWKATESSSWLAVCSSQRSWSSEHPRQSRRQLRCFVTLAGLVELRRRSPSSSTTT